MSSLYIHFPYCLYKCTYCDFNSYQTPADRIHSDEYIKTLTQEILQRKQIFEETGKHFLSPSTKINTIFIGGGTPSLMSAKNVADLLQVLNQHWKIDSTTEITLEANPKTVTLQSLMGFKNAGINRLSMGVQSLKDNYLSAFGRIHTADEAREAITWVKKVFQNWSFDLIFGFPGQTFSEWQEILQEAVTFSSPHLSCYSFTVEKDAPYSKMVASGKAKLPDEDIQAEMFEWTQDYLTQQNYDPYEVSNFAKAGKQSQHNLNYWNYGEYLGLGAGAVSFLRSLSFPRRRESTENYLWIPDQVGDDGQIFGYRTTNKKLPRDYANAVEKNAGIFDVETIDRKTAMGEFVMMGLRLKKGLSREYFENLFGEPIDISFAPQLKEAYAQGLLKEETLSLTPKGFPLANQVLLNFI